MERVIYIGPNSKKLGLTRNTVYEEGLPYNVKQALEEVPELQRLIVGIEQLDEKQAKAKRKGTPEYRACEVIAGLRG